LGLSKTGYAKRRKVRCQSLEWTRRVSPRGHKSRAHPTQMRSFFSRMPRRVPELSPGPARRGDAGMHRVDEGAGSPFRQPPAKATNLPGANLNSQRLARRAKTMDGFRSNAGDKRHPGVFSFGYFSLDKQRKVSRLSVREPTFKTRRDSDTKPKSRVGTKNRAHPTKFFLDLTSHWASVFRESIQKPFLKMTWASTGIEGQQRESCLKSNSLAEYQS